MVVSAVYGMRDSIRKSANEDLELKKKLSVNGPNCGDSKATKEDTEYKEITMEHFLQAFQKVRESKLHCGTLPLGRIDLDWPLFNFHCVF